MAPTIKTIACYQTHQEYSVNFFGDEVTVTQTETPSVIRRWIHSTLFNHRRSSTHPLVVGVGVQWTPNCYNSDSSSDDNFSPADTLQLCVGTRCIIIQLTHCDRVPQVLRRFLGDLKTTFVGIWNSQDEKKLRECRHQLWIGGDLLDLRKYVTDSEGRSMRGCSFQKIVEERLGYQGVKLDPQISMSDWSVCYLDLDQIVQASVDAFVCCELGVEERLWEV